MDVLQLQRYNLKMDRIQDKFVVLFLFSWVKIIVNTASIAKRLTRVTREPEVWISNSGLANTSIALQTVRHRLNIAIISSCMCCLGAI